MIAQAQDSRIAERALQDRTIVLIAKNFGPGAGGEAIKPYQYARFLMARGYRFLVVAHERSSNEMGADLPPSHLKLVSDDPLQKTFWAVPPLRPLLDLVFHLKARRRIVALGLDPARTILHYIGPVSPVALRFPPKGFRTVMGPFTGNIHHPPAFRDRMSGKDKLRERLHGLSQRVFGRVFGDKRAAEAVLVSGYERTRASLKLAGCADERLIDVADAGVDESIAALPRLTHSGRNPSFMFSSRLVEYKGVDLAIRALERTAPDITLDVYGDGDRRPRLESLAAELGLGGRVRFHGWVEHDALPGMMAKHRAFVFPSLAEANGIVMQEAMMLGLPMVTLRWGGPAMLADADSAVFIEPRSEEHVVAELARAMDRLADDGDEAERLSRNARAAAEARFTWDAVARSWEEAYRRVR